MNKLNFILLVAILLFTACEYGPSGSNFLDLTPPEDQIPVEISLNDIDPSDTIYLYQPTSFSLRINSPNDLKQVVVVLDKEELINMWGNSIGFVFYPDQVEEGMHKLTIGAAFSSGTGSLAEMVGMEGYAGELSWNIRAIHNPQDRFKVDYRINEEGFLELFWDNAIPENFIESYTIHSGLTQESDITIYNATQKSFVDYGYVCGYAFYEVKTQLKDGMVFRETLSIDRPTPAVYFEDVDLNNLRVYWDKPFANGRFNIILDDKNIIASNLQDTTITIPQLWGKTRQFIVEVKPRIGEYDNFHNKKVAYGNFTQGIYLDIPNWPLYAYNGTDNIIYTSSYDDLVAFDATTLQKINSVPIKGNPWGLLYGGKIASAPHNSTVAAMTGEETWIFSDSRFVNPVIIKPLSGNIHTRLAALTSNDRFFVVQKESNSCHVFNSLTGEKIFQFPFTYPTIYDIPDHVSVSENGQYFCASSENGIEIFEIDGTATKLRYTDTRHYKGAMFLPSHPEQLLLRVGSHFELREIPDFNIVQTLEVAETGVSLCNIDPATMNLLYHQNDSLRVCRVNDMTKTIFTIRSDERDAKIFNNKLMTRGNGGIAFDMDPYVNNSGFN